MSNTLLAVMDYDEFESLMDSYIERSSQESGEMPAGSFFELLFTRAAQQAQETIEVKGEIVEGQLQFSLPEEVESAVQVQGNRIVIGSQVIVVRLKNGFPAAGSG